MVRNPVHEMLVQPIHDERARQHYTLSLKDYIRDHVRVRNEDIYKHRAKPEFVRRHGDEPKSQQDIGSVMWEDPAYQIFSRMHRDGQEMMWDAAADTISRERHRLSAAFNRLSTSNTRLGSLELNPDLELPRGMREVDIHLQPGGY